MRAASGTFRAVALVALLVLGATMAHGESAVRSDVDARRIGVQDQLQLTIRVSGSSLPGQVNLPALSNLRVVGGPSVSTEMSWVNGAASQSRSWTYVLQPVAIGRAEVGGVRVRVASGELSAPAISIEVVPGNVKPPPPARRSFFDQDPFSTMPTRRRIEPQLMVEAKPSRTSLYVGEPLLLTYYLYTNTSVSGLKFDDVPQFSGFWAEDLQQNDRPKGEAMNVNGIQYERFPVLLKLLYPTKAGRLTIPAAKLSIGIPQSLFESGGVVQRSTDPVTIVVKPIPDQPGFSGAVGRFRATSSVDRSSLAIGEAATLRFRVEGSGNIKWIDRGPELSVPGAKVYPPQVKSDLQTRSSGISGSRTWEYVVVPQTAGTLEIPALAFSWFDPSNGKVNETMTPPQTLTVTGAGSPSAFPLPAPGAGTPSRGGPLPLRADLERPATGAIPGSAVGGVAGAVLLLHGALLAGSRLGRLRRPGGARGAAPRGVRGALADLQRVGSGGMSKEAAASQIEKTLHGVFGSLDSDESERARAVRDLLADVHQVRYAPQLGDYSEQVRDLASRAEGIVRRWA